MERLDIAKELGNNMGNVDRALRVLKQSIENHKQHLGLVRELRNTVAAGDACHKLGLAYHLLGDFKQAIEYRKQCLSIVKHLGDKAGEGRVYNQLGGDYVHLREYQKAIECHQQHLRIAKELGHRAGEGVAYENLGIAYKSLEDFKQAIEYHKQLLSIAKELGDRAGEGRAYEDLGAAYKSLEDFKQATEYHKQLLSIAKELGDRAGEGRAYKHLGAAYKSLGDFKQAIEYYQQGLGIAKELGDKTEEEVVYFELGDAYNDLGDFKQAIEYHKQQVCIAKERGDRVNEGLGYTNIGVSYYGLGDIKQAIEYQQQRLSIAKELGDRDGEGVSYTNLGNAYHALGYIKQAIEYHKQELSIFKELGDKERMGYAYNNLGASFVRLRAFKQSIQYQKQSLRIAEELGDKMGKGLAYNNLGIAYHDLGDFKQAIDYHNQQLSIAKELGNKDLEMRAYCNLGRAYYSQSDFKQAIEYHKQSLSVAKELRRRSLEGYLQYYLGLDFETSGALHEAADYYQRSVNLRDEFRTLLQYEDAWKITFRNFNKDSYTALWRTLVKLSRCDQALCVAEKGRAQALVDLIKSQYSSDLTTSGSLEPKPMIFDMISDVSSPTLFVALEGNTIHSWLLCKGRNIQFKQKVVKDVKVELEDVVAYLERLRISAFKEIRGGARVICENRSLDELRVEDELPPTKEKSEGTINLSQSKSTSLRFFHDCIISPISDLLEGDELVVVPDGPLCLAPFAAFLDSESKYLSESMRIRILPSLMSLKLIHGSAEDYHEKSGVLLVGDPCLEELTDLLGYPFFAPLPYARKEVEMIGGMLGIPPLTGKEATNAEVLRRITSVAVVHIAAHGKMETGEIALAPNPSRTSNSPEGKDYRLTISDVQTAKLRARLVVLSCCHSAQGRVSAEGVVGIARAFLGAGARSVLVSLWAIDDKATMEFMRSFYKHLKDGHSASVSLNRAMECLRKSKEFGAVRYWAPFVLIGDDVTIEFGENV